MMKLLITMRSSRICFKRLDRRFKSSTRTTSAVVTAATEPKEATAVKLTRRIGTDAPSMTTTIMTHNRTVGGDQLTANINALVIKIAETDQKGRIDRIRSIHLSLVLKIDAHRPKLTDVSHSSQSFIMSLVVVTQQELSISLN